MKTQPEFKVVAEVTFQLIEFDNGISQVRSMNCDEILNRYYFGKEYKHRARELFIKVMDSLPKFWRAIAVRPGQPAFPTWGAERPIKLEKEPE